MAKGPLKTKVILSGHLIRQLVCTSLLLINTFLFTCSESKSRSIIKKSPNIKNVIVAIMFNKKMIHKYIIWLKKRQMPNLSIPFFQHFDFFEGFFLLELLLLENQICLSLYKEFCLIVYGYPVWVILGIKIWVFYKRRSLLQYNHLRYQLHFLEAYNLHLHHQKPHCQSHHQIGCQKNLLRRMRLPIKIISIK